MSCSSRMVVQALWLIHPPALHHWSNTQNVLWNVYFLCCLLLWSPTTYLKSLNCTIVTDLSSDIPLAPFPPPPRFRSHHYLYPLALSHSCSHEANIRDGEENRSRRLEISVQKPAVHVKRSGGRPEKRLPLLITTLFPSWSVDIHLKTTLPSFSSCADIF